MRRTSIKPKRLHELAVEFLASRPGREYPEGGRPREYEDALILTIACIQNLHGFSYREALEFCEDFFGEIPTLSTYHYRLKTLPPDIPKRFIEHIAGKIEKSAPEKGRFFVLDGTGFSFEDIYPMRFFRGTEIRHIQSHVKVEVLMAGTGARKFVASAFAGRAYASEVKLAMPLLRGLDPPPGSDILGDKGYDCNRLIRKILEKNCTPVIDIKEGRGLQTIKSPERLMAREYSDDWDRYKRRTLIEGLFGNTKQKLTSHIKVWNGKIARHFALLRLALLNAAVLAKLEKELAMLWIWFSNSASRPLDTYSFSFTLSPTSR